MTRAFILAVALAAVHFTTAQITQTANITLAGLSCTGHAFTGLPAKYAYNLTLNSLTVATGCADINIRISKLYVEGACASKRDNSFSCVL